MIEDELSRLYDYDELKFRESSARDLDSVKTQSQIIARIIYSAHAMEKALSNDRFVQGRGFDNARMLVHLLGVYRERGYDTLNDAYVAALAALKEFYGANHGSAFEDELVNIYGVLFDDIMSCSSKLGGAATISVETKKHSSQKTFKELAESRASIRSYANRSVDLQMVREALGIAMKTPTVCNRQSIKVRYIQDKGMIAEILEIQGGAKGYDTPPLLLLITADDSAYLGANERNQGFVDGGLFAMSLLYALEYKELAACALNAALTESAEKDIRHMMNISNAEKLITFISVGHFKKTNKICKSFRYSADSIFFEVEAISKHLNHGAVSGRINIKAQRKTSAVSYLKKIKPRSRIKSLYLNLKKKTRIRTRIRNSARVLRQLKARYNFRKPDGAILTLIDYNNYGNILQRFALQAFLLQKGYTFVSYEHELPIKSSLDDKRFENISKFIEENIYVRPLPHSHELDCYIVGSDQIWRDFSYQDPERQLGFFFLNFLGERKCKRVAYAASLGRNSLSEAKISDKLLGYTKHYIKKFDTISVREQSAVKIIKKAWGIDAARVADPTLLLTADTYSKIINKAIKGLEDIDGIFAYLIGVYDENERFLHRAAEHVNESVFRIDIADYSASLPPVEQWLVGVRDAKLVVTDSFHATLFSIINNTDFFVLENDGSGTERMADFLDSVGVTGRVIRRNEVDAFSFNDVQPIDWESVNSKINELRNWSSEWLLDAITS